MPNISAKFVIRKTYQQSEQYQNSTGKSYGKYDMHARGRGSRSRCSVHFVLVIRNVGSRVLPFREFRLYYNSQQIHCQDRGLLILIILTLQMHSSAHQCDTLQWHVLEIILDSIFFGLEC